MSHRWTNPGLGDPTVAASRSALETLLGRWPAEDRASILRAAEQYGDSGRRAGAVVESLLADLLERFDVLVSVRTRRAEGDALRNAVIRALILGYVPAEERQ